MKAKYFPPSNIRGTLVCARNIPPAREEPTVYCSP